MPENKSINERMRELQAEAGGPVEFIIDTTPTSSWLICTLTYAGACTRMPVVSSVDHAMDVLLAEAERAVGRIGARTERAA